MILVTQISKILGENFTEAKVRGIQGAQFLQTSVSSTAPHKDILCVSLNEEFLISQLLSSNSAVQEIKL